MSERQKAKTERVVRGYGVLPKKKPETVQCQSFAVESRWQIKEK
jgi:hypothetical protein